MKSNSSMAMKNFCLLFYQSFEIPKFKLHWRIFKTATFPRFSRNLLPLPQHQVRGHRHLALAWLTHSLSQQEQQQQSKIAAEILVYIVARLLNWNWKCFLGSVSNLTSVHNGNLEVECPSHFGADGILGPNPELHDACQLEHLDRGDGQGSWCQAKFNQCHGFKSTNLYGQ